MTGAVRAQPTGFSLRVPPSWIEFDIWRATRTGDLGRLVDARIAQTPDLRPHRGTLIKLLREIAGEAERNDAVYCATMGEIVEDAGMLAATAMAFHTMGSPNPAENTVEAIASQIPAYAPSAASKTWRVVELVEIPAGRAVRTRGVESIEQGGRSIDCVFLQTLIPVPNNEGVLAIVLSSPQVELAEPMLDLFDAISSTLEWAA